VRGNRVERILPAGAAALWVAAGSVLYLDSSGLLTLGLYPQGFGLGAAMAAFLLSLAAVWFIVRGPHRQAGWAVLLSLTLYALLRLPSGNVWDALLDPLLWLWAIFSLLARACSSAVVAPVPS